eukprot:351400-Chlamydomonas_euryale.AAC.1
MPPPPPTPQSAGVQPRPHRAARRAPAVGGQARVARAPAHQRQRRRRQRRRRRYAPDARVCQHDRHGAARARAAGVPRPQRQPLPRRPPADAARRGDDVLQGARAHACA